MSTATLYVATRLPGSMRGSGEHGRGAVSINVSGREDASNNSVAKRVSQQSISGGSRSDETKGRGQYKHKHGTNCGEKRTRTLTVRFLAIHRSVARKFVRGGLILTLTES